MAEQSKTLGIVIITAIVLIIGLVLFQGITEPIYRATNMLSVTNESLTFANNAVTINLVNTNINSVSYFGNNTFDFTSNLTKNVNWTTGGLVTIDGVVINTNTTYRMSYIYKPSGYVDDGTSRTIVNLIVVFFALAVLAVGIYGLYNTGLFDMLKK